ALDNIITGGAGNDTLFGGVGADQFIGGAGIDTVSYGDSSSVGVSINLKTGVHGGIATGDTFNGIEIIQGSSFNDTFVSGAAADQLDGSGGYDTIDYSASSSAVTASLVNGVLGAGGDAEGDKLSNF
ncbi:calcium-binding protein, partial [Pseudomonas yamanorum]|nr:calcium-binding protein [Pseudomonas yamanorum]